MSRTRRLTRSQPRSLLSMAKLNIARSRTACTFWRWMRMAQMSFGLRGGFWPTSVPLFHDSRWLIASMTQTPFVVDGSLIVSLHGDGGYRVGCSVIALGQNRHMENVPETSRSEPLSVCFRL